MSNSKSTLYKLQFEGEGSALNLNSYKADIHPFISYNERNAPFYGGTLSPIYYQKKNKNGEILIDKNYNEYSIDSNGNFSKNGETIKTLSNKKFVKEEINIKNLRDYFSNDLYIIDNGTNYKLFIAGEEIEITSSEKPETYLYKHEEEYCALIGNTAYYKNTTAGELITKELYEITNLSNTPTSFDGYCICYINNLNSIVFQSKQFFAYIDGGVIKTIVKPSNINYLYLTEDGLFTGFRYYITDSKRVKVEIYAGIPTLNDGTTINIPLVQNNTLQTGRSEVVDYIANNNFTGFNTYGNYSSFSPYFTIFCNEPTAVKEGDYYTMHYIADAYLGNGNFGLMRYYSIDNSSNVQYPFGYYITKGNWRVLLDKGVIRNVSFVEDEKYRGTIVAAWDSLDIDKNLYITNDEVIYCNAETNTWYKIKTVEATPEIKLIGNRHIIINTTDYFNSYDIETGLFHHIADDWNNRVSPNWIDNNIHSYAEIRYNVYQYDFKRQSSGSLYNFTYYATISLNTSVPLPNKITMGGCSIPSGELSATANATYKMNSSNAYYSQIYELKVGASTVKKIYATFTSSIGTKASGIYTYSTDEGFNDSNTIYTSMFTSLESGMETISIASAVNPMYTITNIPYCSMIENPSIAFIPRTFNQYTAKVNASMENKPIIKYGYYGEQTIDVFLDNEYSWSIYNKEYVNNTENTSTSLDSNATIKNSLEGTTYPTNTNGNIFYNFPIFFEYIETTTNQDLISIDGISYSMSYYSNQLILLYLMDSAASFFGITDAFVVQGTNYALANGKIIEYSIDENGSISNSKIILSVEGLRFIAATPYNAIFWSNTNKSFYSFTGDRTISLIKQADSINEISRNTIYNPATGSIIIPTDTGLLITNDVIGEIRIKNKENDEFETTNCKVFITNDGIALTTTNYIYYLSYNKKDNYDKLPINLKTMFYGLGNNMLSVNDTVYIKLLDTDKASGYLKISAITLTNEGKEIEEKEFKIKPTDWDKITDTFYIRYQPKNQRSIGVSYNIETPFRIAEIYIGNTPDVVQVAKHNF